MSANQPRKPAGTPAGGQWAPMGHAEADINLVIASSPEVAKRIEALPDKARSRLAKDASLLPGTVITDHDVERYEHGERLPMASVLEVAHENTELVEESEAKLRETLSAEEDVVFSYSRAQALEEGELVDAGEMAREAGFRYPVALTRGAWEDAVAWDEENGALQDERGRLWDVLMTARSASKRAAAGRDRVSFNVLRIPNDRRASRPQQTELVVHIGPGDDAEPVITIMKPGED